MAIQASLGFIDSEKGRRGHLWEQLEQQFNTVDSIPENQPVLMYRE